MISRKLVAAGALAACMGFSTLGAQAASAADASAPSALPEHCKVGKTAVEILDYKTIRADGAPVSKKMAGGWYSVEFRVKPECVGTTVGLAAYTAKEEVPTWDNIPDQVLFGAAQTTIGSGGRQMLMVRVPDTCYQADFFVGNVIEKFGPPDTLNYYRDRLISSESGYTGCAAVAPTEEEPAPPVQEPTPEEPAVQPEAVEQGAVKAPENRDPERVLAAETPAPAVKADVKGEEVKALGADQSPSVGAENLARTGQESVPQLAIGAGLLGAGVMLAGVGAALRRRMA